jgi:hypothetical protein
VSDSSEPSPWLRLAGPIAIAVGGVVAGVGCWLAWFAVKRGTTGVVIIQRGVRGSDGQVLFAFAIIALACGVIALFRPGRSTYFWLGGVALLAGLWISAVSTFDASTPKDRFVDSAAATLVKEGGVPKDQAAIIARQLIETGVVTIKLQSGIFITIGGGAAIILGSAATLLIARRVQEPEATEEETEGEGESEEADSEEFDSEEIDSEDAYSEEVESEGAESEEAESVYDSE